MILGCADQNDPIQCTQGVALTEYCVCDTQLCNVGNLGNILYPNKNFIISSVLSLLYFLYWFL